MEGAVRSGYKAAEAVLADLDRPEILIKPGLPAGRLARLLLGLYRRAPKMGVHVELAPVNGQPGGISYDSEARVVSVFVLDIADGLVQTVRSIVNPDKLRHLGPVSDVALRGVPGGSSPRG